MFEFFFSFSNLPPKDCHSFPVQTRLEKRYLWPFMSLDFLKTKVAVLGKFKPHNLVTCVWHPWYGGWYLWHFTYFGFSLQIDPLNFNKVSIGSSPVGISWFSSCERLEFESHRGRLWIQGYEKSLNPLWANLLTFC